jgi:hypothetical protein
MFRHRCKKDPEHPQVMDDNLWNALGFASILGTSVPVPRVAPYLQDVDIFFKNGRIGARLGTAARLRTGRPKASVSGN